LAAQPNGVDQMSSSRRIGAVVDERRRVLQVSLPGEFVQRRDAQPVRPARIHAALKEEFGKLARLARATHAPGQVGPAA
jgi:hypothetical protein